MLLSIAGIQANKQMSQSQIISFFELLNPPDEELDNLSDWIYNNYNGSGTTVPLSELDMHINQSYRLFIQLDILRECLIMSIIGRRTFIEISDRIYYFKYNKGEIIKEAYCCRIIRKIKGYPPLFYCNYKQKVEDKVIILSLRKKYGYSQRIGRDSTSSNKNRPSLLYHKSSLGYKNDERKSKKRLFSISTRVHPEN